MPHDLERLVREPADRSPHYDPALAKLASAMNAAIDEARSSNSDADRQLALIRTSKGLVPVWCRVSESSEPPDGGKKASDDELIASFGL